MRSLSVSRKLKIWREFLDTPEKVFLTFDQNNEMRKYGEDSVERLRIAGIEFIFVKGGCYQMGDTFGNGNDDEKPIHEVCIDDFYIGKYEVTQGQWEDFMGDNPSRFKKGRNCPVRACKLG